MHPGSCLQILNGICLICLLLLGCGCNHGYYSLDRRYQQEFSSGVCTNTDVTIQPVFIMLGFDTAELAKTKVLFFPANTNFNNCTDSFIFSQGNLNLVPPMFPYSYQKELLYDSAREYNLWFTDYCKTVSCGLMTSCDHDIKVVVNNKQTYKISDLKVRIRIDKHASAEYCCLYSYKVDGRTYHFNKFIISKTNRMKNMTRGYFVRKGKIYVNKEYADDISLLRMKVQNN